MGPAPIAPLATALTDGVVSVRMRRDGDLVDIAAAAQDPEAARWLDEPPSSATPSTPDQIAAIWRSGRAAPMLVADAATDEAAGLINLQFRSGYFTSVAYRIFPAWRGRGYAARALDLVTDWALGSLDLPGLVLEIDEANTASIRVAQRCGYVRSGSTADGAKAVFARKPALS